LLVDDNEDDRRLVERLLHEAQFNQLSITEADCLAQALTLVEHATFDLCVVDWELPDGTGIELAQHPFFTQKSLPVIIVTGNERPEQGSFAVGRGAADFIPKNDLTARTLGRACSHAIARSALEREIEQLRKAQLAATEREHAARLAAEASLVEERRARERVTWLHSLSSLLGAATTSREIGAWVVQRMASFEAAAAVTLHLLKDELLLLEGSTGIDDGARSGLQSLPLTAASPLSESVRSGLPRHFELNELHGRRGLAVPLSTSSGVFGLLTVFFDEHAFPAPDQLAYIELVAQHVAEALQRARLYEAAQHTAEFEERLLTIVGHDLRTPLSAIVMVAHLLEARGLAPDLVARLERSAHRMNELISDVLDRAAVRRGVSSQRTLDTADLEALLQDQVDELRAALPNTPIELEIHGAVTVQCEPSRTSQIVSNLVRNAAQHGHAATPVTVRLSQADHGNHAEITVHNSGAPIPPEELPHLFDPFKRGRGAGGAGTGLGLFIVQESVAALGGEVLVLSDTDGTTFKVTLPAWSAPTRGDSNQESTSS
jgi:signal transduction histidine kinase